MTQAEQEILNKTKEYYELVQEKKFVDGESRVNYAGRVFDSSLDFWLTYSKKFEKQLAKYLGVRWAFLVNSANL